MLAVQVSEHRRRRAGRGSDLAVGKLAPVGVFAVVDRVFASGAFGDVEEQERVGEGLAHGLRQLSDFVLLAFPRRRSDGGSVAVMKAAIVIIADFRILAG